MILPLFTHPSYPSIHPPSHSSILPFILPSSYLSIHSLNKYLQSTCHVSGTVLGNGTRAINKAKSLTSWHLCSRRRRTAVNKQHRTNMLCHVRLQYGLWREIRHCPCPWRFSWSFEGRLAHGQLVLGRNEKCYPKGVETLWITSLLLLGGVEKIPQRRWHLRRVLQQE